MTTQTEKFETAKKPGKPSYRLTFDDAVEVWKMRWAGEIISRIAGRFDVNMARVHEVLAGTRHPGSEQVARGMAH